MESTVPEIQRSSNPNMTVSEIIKEISIIEREISHLEKHLLSLYQKMFEHRLIQRPGDDVINGVTVREEYYESEGKQGHCRHSSLSHEYSAYYNAIQSPVMAKDDDAVYSYHSLPVMMFKHASDHEASNNAICILEIEDQLRLHNSSQVITETSNWISEEMVRCISAIYCELAVNSMITRDFSSPVVSIASSATGSPRDEFNLWSPPSRINSSLDLRSDIRFHAERYEEFSGPYSQMVEVIQIDRDSVKMKQIEPMLQKFRSLVNRLEGVNPSRLKHEEKLAFWINVHNALVMHAFLVYGIPQSKLKRVSLLLKAAYNIGGHTISVGMIQNYILGHQLPHPGQWFRWLLHSKKKLKARDERISFVIDRFEPLSYFALCCGSHSDPPVRVYTPKRVFQDLIAARGEYILTNYTFNKEQTKILLPKIVENYFKDSGLHPVDFMSIIEQIIPIDHQSNRTCRYSHNHRKGLKGIGWIPHNFAFRYHFSKELFQ